MPQPRVDGEQIEQVREFNRFYTQLLGILNDRYLDKRFNLAEIRVLFEVGYQQSVMASKLAEQLALDPGYISRIVAKLNRAKLVNRMADAQDRRKKLLSLTATGRRELKRLETLSRKQVRQMLSPLEPEDRVELLASMRGIQELFEPGERPTVVIRPLRIGDIGHIVERHGVIYSRSYGWDKSFEWIVLKVLNDYVTDFQEGKEDAWVAEVNGQFAGSVLSVVEEEGVARLRTLIVEPKYRGLGVGGQLVEQVVSFCRGCGYKKIVLWTCDELKSARRLYERFGFIRIRQWDEPLFGTILHSEHWELEL